MIDLVSLHTINNEINQISSKIKCKTNLILIRAIAEYCFYSNSEILDSSSGDVRIISADGIEIWIKLDRTLSEVYKRTQLSYKLEFQTKYISDIIEYFQRERQKHE